MPLQPCTPALAFSTVATLESPIQPSLQRPEAWSIASFEGRLFALYEERHTLSFSNPFLLGFDADIACSGQVLGRTLVLSIICMIDQQYQWANALPRTNWPSRQTPLRTSIVSRSWIRNIMEVCQIAGTMVESSIAGTIVENLIAGTILLLSTHCHPQHSYGRDSSQREELLYSWIGSLRTISYIP